jgi:hypothetical protein
MRIPHLRLAALILTAIAAILISCVALALHHTKAPHQTKQAAHTTIIPKASPAKLAADKAAYKASTAKLAQLEQAYQQAMQAEQTARDKYGDGSPEYQTAHDATTQAYNAYGEQSQDAASKSLQVQIDGGSTTN